MVLLALLKEPVAASEPITLICIFLGRFLNPQDAAGKQETVGFGVASGERELGWEGKECGK